jgi:hypothetical protein
MSSKTQALMDQAGVQGEGKYCGWRGAVAELALDRSMRSDSGLLVAGFVSVRTEDPWRDFSAGAPALAVQCSRLT